jgi:hypothetical protein
MIWLSLFCIDGFVSFFVGLIGVCSLWRWAQSSHLLSYLFCIFSIRVRIFHVLSNVLDDSRKMPLQKNKAPNDGLKHHRAMNHDEAAASPTAANRVMFVIFDTVPTVLARRMKNEVD